MKKLPLSQTNPFLKDPEERRFWLFTTVASSAAIEGVHLSKKVLEKTSRGLGFLHQARLRSVLRITALKIFPIGT